MHPTSEALPLKDQFKQALEEARVVLPGIQALFGFQLIAVFNAKFDDLPTLDQRLHLAALFLTALSIISAMAPAALHRQVDPKRVSERLVDLSTAFLTFGMLPLGIGIVLDGYIVANLVLRNPAIATTVGVALAAILFGTWFAVPRLLRRRIDHP